MAVNNGQKGFWVKKVGDASPVFIGLGQADTPDSVVESSKQNMLKQLGQNVEWSGEDPGDFNISAATGNVKQNTPASPDLVGDTYFDTLLTNLDKTSAEQSRISQQGLDTYLAYLKKDRQLFNEGMARSYGQALQKANINAYDRGLGDSGVKTENFRDTTTEKDYTEKQRDFSDQKAEVQARQQFENNEVMRKLAEERTRASIKSPYAEYQYK